MNWKSPTNQILARLALKEDAANHDITTQTLIPRGLKLEAQIRSNGQGVICGQDLAEACFKTLDPRCLYIRRAQDGQWVKPHTLIAVIRGRAHTILSAERSALNALQHLSGIATYTRHQINQLHSRKTAIYDTRKTLPGWRELQKYAVRCGGGKNHRMSLKSSVLIKDNHLKICRLIKKDWIEALQRLRSTHPSLPVEIEIQTQRDMKEALSLVPQQVLLDNMNLRKLRKMIRFLRPRLPGVEIEISGGIQTHHLDTLRHLGIERISMGRLTHSSPAFDCTLDITRVINPR